MLTSDSKQVARVWKAGPNERDSGVKVWTGAQIQCAVK